MAHVFNRDLRVYLDALLCINDTSAEIRKPRVHLVKNTHTGVVCPGTRTEYGTHRCDRSCLNSEIPSDL